MGKKIILGLDLEALKLMVENIERDNLKYIKEHSIYLFQGRKLRLEMIETLLSGGESFSAHGLLCLEETALETERKFLGKEALGNEREE